MRKDQEFELMKKHLTLKNDCYTPNVLKSMVLDNAKNIYANQHVRDMKVLTMNGGGGEGGNDSAGALMAQMLASYKAISSSMEQ